MTGEINAEEFIIGGSEASPGKFPWQARLQIYYPGSGKNWTVCGGVIWNRNWIITAAQCLFQWFVLY